MTYTKFERHVERLYERMLKEQSELLSAGAVKQTKGLETTLFEGDTYESQLDFVEELYAKVNSAQAILNSYPEIVALSKTIDLERKKLSVFNTMCEAYKKVGGQPSYVAPFEIFSRTAKIRKNLVDLEELLENKKISTNIDVPEELSKYFDEFAN